MPIVILAHGGLGAFDEIIFVSVALIFVGMMAFSWFRSQQLSDSEELLDTEGELYEDTVQSQTTNSDRFKLE